MEFGSAFVLSTPVKQAVDFDEVIGMEYFAGIRSAMNKNSIGSGNNLCLLEIIDAVVPTDYATTGSHYADDVQAFLIVFSITDRDSFEAALSIYEFCCCLRGTYTVPAVLCANKWDLESSRQVWDLELFHRAGDYNLPVFTTSAKQNINIDEAFTKLVQITPWTGWEYKIAVVGVGDVGKSAIIRRFTQNLFVHASSSTREHSYRKQIAIPGLLPPSPNLRALKVGKPPKTPFRVILSLLGSSSRASKASPLPSLNTPTFIQRPRAARRIRQIPKKDTNVLMLDLGTLDIMDDRKLTVLPSTCSTCSAVVSASSSCVFCSAASGRISTGNLEARTISEEYTLVKGIKSSLPQNDGHIRVPVDEDDTALVVFCIDVSRSILTMQQVKGQGKGDFSQHPESDSTCDVEIVGPSPGASRLESIQDTINVHLDRLGILFPARRVAIITFGNELECFFGSTSSSALSVAIDPFDLKSIEDCMDAARAARPVEWRTISESIEAFRTHVANLATKSATALGPALAVALGLAREHKRETDGAATEIFVYTDGTSNTGIGATDQPFLASDLHGLAFYCQVGKIARDQSAKIHVVDIEAEDAALGVLASAVSASGGVVTTVDELRTQPRVVATDVSIKLFAANGWQFTSDPRPGVFTSKNTLTYKLAKIRDEAEVGFAFGASDGHTFVQGAPQPFQAQIRYTSARTGDTRVRILNRVVPVTSDRALAERTVDVALMGTYALQHIAFGANQVLMKTREDVKAQVVALRDGLYASHQLLLRGAKAEKQQDELRNFVHESAQLDLELERMMIDGTIPSARRPQSMKTLARLAKFTRHSLAGGEKVDQERLGC